jgi:hypothetical protein
VFLLIYKHETLTNTSLLTISLRQKDLPSFFFGYDWHWRAEDTCVGRGKCSTTVWPRNVKKMQDDVSRTLFTILPARFAFVGGTCAREQIRKFLDSTVAIQRRTLMVPISSVPNATLEFDLLIKAGKPVRIIVYASHPSVAWFEGQRRPGIRTQEPRIQTLNFEAASIFVLWVLGKPHDSISFQLHPSSNHPRNIHHPVLEMRQYLKLETSQKIMLNENQLSTVFLHWA